MRKNSTATHCSPRDIITERAEGHYRRRAATPAGQLVQTLASGHRASLSPQLPPVRAPWVDILARVSRLPLTGMAATMHNHHERAAAATRAHLRDGSIFTTALLNETTLRASRSCIDGQMCMSRTIQFLRPQSPCHARLQEVLAAEHIKATYGARDNQHFTPFTDNHEALDRLGQTPYIGTTCDLIKIICRRLRDTRYIVVRVDRVPGNAGGIRNGTSYAYASEHFELRSDPASPAPFARYDPAQKPRLQPGTLPSSHCENWLHQTALRCPLDCLVAHIASPPAQGAGWCRAH